MTEFEFENNTHNLRVASINFDALRQSWEYQRDEYGPDEENAAKFYIGKIGHFTPDSYITGDYGVDFIGVTFANGHSVMVTTADVIITDEAQTKKEFLPVIGSKDDELKYTPLTTEEKEFADKAVLTMLANYTRDDYCSGSFQTALLHKAIALAISRSHMYSRIWDKTVEDV